MLWRCHLEGGLGTRCSRCWKCIWPTRKFAKESPGQLVASAQFFLESQVSDKTGGPGLCLLHLHLVWCCRLLGGDFADQWWSASSAWEAGISWLLPSSSPSWAQGSGYTIAPSVCLKQRNYAQKLLKEYKVVKSSEKCYNIACSAFTWILRACKFDSL